MGEEEPQDALQQHITHLWPCPIDSTALQPRTQLLHGFALSKYKFCRQLWSTSRVLCCRSSLRLRAYSHRAAPAAALCVQAWNGKTGVQVFCSPKLVSNMLAAGSGDRYWLLSPSMTTPRAYCSSVRAATKALLTSASSSAACKPETPAESLFLTACSFIVGYVTGGTHLMSR